MQIKNIAILGSSGYIGQELIRVLKPNYNDLLLIDKQQDENTKMIDLNNPENFNYDLIKNYDLIIITAAISSPDICKNQYQQSYQINVIGTRYFIQRALKNQCKILFFSSDAVFGKYESTQFDEKSSTKADTAYGLMKKEIEDCFKHNKLFKAIRLSYVISKNDKFTKYLFHCKENDKTAEIFHPFYRNVVILSDVLLSIEWLINNWDLFESSFLNICGNELISRLQIVDEINRFSRDKINYVVIQPEKNFFKNRPKVTEMKSIYLSKILEDKNATFSNKIKKQLSL